MQKTTDISQKVFSEIKEILQKLSDCQTIDDFLDLNIERSQLEEYTIFLKINSEFEGETSHSADYSNKIIEDIYDDQSQINEWDRFNNEEIVEIKETPIIEGNSTFENNDLESTMENIDVLEDLNYSTLDFEEEDETLLKADSEIEDEVILKIIGENLPDETITFDEEQSLISSEDVERLELKHQEERKFRLSNIKGVKKMETLFEDDFLRENLSLETTKKPESLIKSNVSLDQMEAKREKPIFKLDLNDRIAFTKKLFSGSQTDLNAAVTKLNEFSNLEEAKEYLSELYYAKNWEKEDEFAQRLWSLVEGKFQ